MNDQLGPYYRYDSGTSLAAAGVSGVLALIQDYFTNTLLFEGDYEFLHSNDPSQVGQLLLQLSYGF